MSPPNEYAWCQFKMTSSKCPYRSKHEVIILTVYIYIALKPCTSHKTSTACFSPAHEYTSSHNFAYLRRFGGDLWWFAYKKRPAAANYHKPQKKRRKYAGFGTMGIPAIRENIVLHRQGLATLKEPNYLIAFVPNSGGGLQWFAVVCSGLRWFA